MFTVRRLAVAASLVILVVLAPPRLRADDEVDPRAVERAWKFLKEERRGRFILGYMHMGTTYAGHKIHDRVLRVPGRDGYFKLLATLDWNDDGTTDAAFLFDRRGNFYQVEVGNSNGVFNRPFAVANLSIQLLGNVLIEAFKDKMTDQDRRQLQQAVDNADSRSLLVVALQLQQSLGQ
jgi:hypothetical protein